MSEFRYTFSFNRLLIPISRKAHRLFDSVEEELEYLEDRGLHDAQVDIFVHHRQNHRKAAELRLSEGRTLEAVDLYLQDTTDELDSMSRAKDIILHNLWQLSPFGVKPVKGEMTKVLERAKKVRPDMMNEMEVRCFATGFRPHVPHTCRW